MNDPEMLATLQVILLRENQATKIFWWQGRENMGLYFRPSVSCILTWLCHHVTTFSETELSGILFLRHHSCFATALPPPYNYSFQRWNITDRNRFSMLRGNYVQSSSSWYELLWHVSDFSLMDGRERWVEMKVHLFTWSSMLVLAVGAELLNALSVLSFIHVLNALARETESPLIFIYSRACV